MSLPTFGQTQGMTEMAAGMAHGQQMARQALRDFIVLGGKAIAGGLVAAIALAGAALVLAANAQAATVTLNDPKAGALLIRTATAGQYEIAPTLETEVAIHVTGMIARTRLTQAFHNPGSESVEGVYVFPLPEKAAVDHLYLRVGERLIEGRVQEKGEARRTYESAKREGRKAALAEQQRPNLFTNSVAHIGPGESVRITIEYQQALAYDDGTYRLRFPLTVTPRYIPAADKLRSDAAQPETQLLQAETRDAHGPVNPVDIAVVIDAGMPIATVKSSYHDVFIAKQAGHRTAVTLVKEQEDADRDFELSWTLAPGNAPQAALFTQTVAGRDYALVMVVPPQPTAAERAAFERVPRETILVADTSGSMQGTSIVQAKAALIHALGTLTERDRFNVVEFNSVTRALWPDALPATEGNIRLARAWVERLRAEGGTEMQAALEFALGAHETPGYLRQVVFITDGAVGNEEALFRLIGAKLGASRLFTVGIGSAPNSHFMTRAAQFGRGTFTHVGDVREVQEKMTALFRKIEAPVLQDVTVTWADGTPVETFPQRVPDLYLGEPVFVSASASAFRGTVIVSGKRGSQPWSAALTPMSEKTGVGALWARARIASLMDEITRGADPAVIRPQVVKVALEHHLVSAYTSLVAVDVTPTAAATRKTALIKVSAPRGAGDFAGTIPQTDTESTLQLLLGLLALGAAAVVAVVGRRAA
jgi:Ca-activated chloride channel family protein